MVKEISFDQIKPHPWIIHAMYTPSNFTPILFRAYSHKMYFLKSGSCQFIVNGICHPMKKNSLIIIRSGTPFKLITNKTDTHALSVTFSYTAYKSEWQHIPNSARAENFDENEPHEEVLFTDHVYFNDTVCLHNMHLVKNYLTECLKEYRLKKLYHDEICSNYLNLILNLVKRDYELHGNSTVYNKKEDYVDAIIEFIHENYNSHISNYSIGKSFNLHPNYINKLMIERTSYSLHQYVIQIRIENAIKLFNTTKMTVSEVGNAVGFNNNSYFSKYFKQKTGKSPSNYILNN